MTECQEPKYRACCDNKLVLAILITFLTLIVLGLIALLLVLLLAPCLIKSCGKVKVTCAYGFQGDNCDECGLTFHTQNSEKIVGGSNAVPSSWPSIAAIAEHIVVNNEPRTMLFCGGTLIDRRTVLTAAHCFSDIDADKIDSPTTLGKFSVYLGLHDQKQLNSGSSRHLRQVPIRKIVLHPDFEETNSFQNDIAILQLAYEVTLSEFVQIACLPRAESGSYPLPGHAAWVAGWGDTAFNGSGSQFLKNTKLTVYDMNKCLGVEPQFQKNCYSQICSGELEGGRDTCQGDSGGPMYVMDVINSKLKYVAAGVVSYGFECGHPQNPGLYTRISYFLPWIENNRL